VKKFSCTYLEQKCAQYLAEEFTDLLNQDVLFTLPISTWKQLLKADRIKVKSESDLFRAVISFSKQQKDPAVRDLILNELLPCIRYPYLTSKFLLEEVEPLEATVPHLRALLYEAYRYKSYPTKHRATIVKPRAGLVFQWSSEKVSTGIQLNGDDMSVTHQGTASTWLSVCGSEFYSSGTHCWDIQIIQNTSQWLFIGVAAKTWQGYSDMGSGYVGHATDSWSYGSYQGWGKVNGTNSAYGATYTNGDIVSIIMDMDHRTLSFGLNGKSLGLAFSNLAAEVTPVVTLYQPGDKVMLSPESAMHWSVASNTNATRKS